MGLATAYFQWQIAALHLRAVPKGSNRLSIVLTRSCVTEMPLARKAPSMPVCPMFGENASNFLHSYSKNIIRDCRRAIWNTIKLVPTIQRCSWNSKNVCNFLPWEMWPSQDFYLIFSNIDKRTFWYISSVNTGHIRLPTTGADLGLKIEGCSRGSGENLFWVYHNEQKYNLRNTT